MRESGVSTKAGLDDDLRLIHLEQEEVRQALNEEEQLYDPLVLRTSPEHEELKEIARG